MSDQDHHANDAAFIDRGTTGKRILLTILFAIVLGLVKTVLAFVVLFELGFSLITERPPYAWVTRFAHHLVRYAYDIGRYMTYNENQLPFPFDELPNGVEPIDLNSAAAR